MKYFIALFLSLTISAAVKAQTIEDSSYQFIFLPGGHHFAPLKGNVQEPRIGVFKFLDIGRMKVDIGNSIDIFGLSAPASKITFTAGIDFFAYAFVTNAQGLRLQIDAIDGFFGGNITFSKEYEQRQLQVRLRILHHSAHLVDGHYNQNTNSWLDNRTPIPFTHDYSELVTSHNIHSSFGEMRYYGGFSYATLIRPSNQKRLSVLAGTEFAFDNLIGPLYHQPTNIFLAYHVDLKGNPEYAATHQMQAGIKFGKWYEKGITIYLGYYTGQNMFAEYFDQRISTLGAGFTVDWF